MDDIYEEGQRALDYLNKQAAGLDRAPVMDGTAPCPNCGFYWTHAGHCKWHVPSHDVSDMRDAPNVGNNGEYVGLGRHFDVVGPQPPIEVEPVVETDMLSDADMLPELRKGLGLDTTNPKDAFGLQKTPLHLIPGPALVEEANVMGNGAWKYGPYNWREKHVRATVYVAAALRHLHSYLDGADYDAAAEEPNKAGEEPPYPIVHHLGAVRACCGILLDALASGTLIDDRPKAAPTEAIILNPLRKVK